MTQVEIGKTYEVHRRAVPTTPTSLNRVDIPASVHRYVVFEIKPIENGRTMHYGHRDGSPYLSGFIIPDVNIKLIREVTP